MTTETKSSNVRLHRIKIVARIAKYICFGFLGSSLVFYIFVYISYFNPWSAFASKATVLQFLLMAMFQIVLCFWYWKLSRLFQSYEKGLIFAAKSIRCIKTLGLLCVIGWVLLTSWHFLPGSMPASQTKTAFPPVAVLDDKSPAILSRRSVAAFRMGFFTFNFGTNFDFGSLLSGATILLIAWVMDEGRKIQEEQELTV